MNDLDQDIRWMHRALELARRGVGLASPNPAVGCVIVSQGGELIGEGWHEYDLVDHAEVAALKDTRRNSKEDRLRGATAYVTLEPCNHTGRTGPCTQALVAAGVSRVVAATADPNPTVAGHGMQALHAAGLRTEIGVCEAEARLLTEPFAKWIQGRRPFVLMKVAMSLDGRIAPPPELRRAREPFWITSEESRAAVQQLRHGADAVLTGIDTVLADDPLLTDRSGLRRRRPLLRVLLDSSLRIPLDSKIVRSAQEDLLIFTTSGEQSRIDELRTRGVRAEAVSSAGEHIPLPAVLEHLGAHEILSVLTETGTRLNTALLSGNFVDRVQFFVSPRLLGDDAVPAFINIPLPLTVPTVENSERERDIVLTSLLRDPWRSS